VLLGLLGQCTQQQQSYLTCPKTVTDYKYNEYANVRPVTKQGSHSLAYNKFQEFNKRFFRTLVAQQCQITEKQQLLTLYIQCESKSTPPKTFCNIFTQATYISVKFCPFISTLIYQFWSIYLNI